MSRIEAVRGTQDLLPEETARWTAAEASARLILSRYGFGEIRTPVFEHVELFKRPLGEGSDVVAKELYEFTDKGDRRLALRPEGTAPVVRAYLEHGLYAKGSRHKLFYLGPVFRYDRPQAGRYRQHHQIGVEVFGNAAPSQDAEVMELGDALLRELGVTGYERRINSNGDAACRPGYEAALRSFVESRKGDLCKDCSGYRLEHNILRVLDCKIERCRAVTADAPKLTDHLCEACRSHHDGVLSHLRTLGLDVMPDPRLVRGFDYYTRTCFEYVPTGAGQQGTLLGGGRYDGLVKLLGGPDTPAVGWGMGLERVLAATPPVNGPATPGAYVIAAVPEGFSRALRITQALRRAGVTAELGAEGKSLASQLRAAGSAGARRALFVGAGTGSIGFKDLAAGTQEELPESDVIARLAGR